MSINKKCIFMFGAGKFDAQYPSTSFNLARQFAKNNNTVFYVDYPFTFRDTIKLKNSAQYKARKEAFAGKNNGIIETHIPNLKVVIVPPLLSIHFLPEGRIYRMLLKLNEKTIIKRLREVIDKYHLKDIVYINSFNIHYPNVADGLKPILKVYHCVDPVITPYDVKHGVVSEKILVAGSDLVVCTSKRLYEEKKLVNRNTHFIPNAADITHSIRATEKDLTLHPSLVPIKKPVIGYFGNIERRINYELLATVAGKNPDKSFVLAGPVVSHLVPRFIYDIPNVYFTGRVPYDQMPGMLKGFDVAIIPFRRDEDSATVFPLKLFEYLGAGKPVVSTDFNPDLASFTFDKVQYCHTPEAFSEAIDSALQNNSEALQKARIELASLHTWERRAADFEELIDRNLRNESNETASAVASYQREAK